MKIEVLPYNDSWPLEFIGIQNELEKILSDFNPQIEHIGSTSVVGLAAKPFIDILIGINAEEDLDKVIIPMMSAGFPYYEKHNVVMPYRRLFVKMKETANELDYALLVSDANQNTDVINDHKWAHIHIMEYNSEHWIRHIAFRDYLRAFPDTKQEYQDLKLFLSTREWKDVMEYNGGKNDFIKQTEALAIEWYLELNK
jgi:GrpB-like predicted nucleotidyltransferase (UPF0157 family)